MNNSELTNHPEEKNTTKMANYANKTSSNELIDILVEPTEITHESASVRTHLLAMQSTIQRMTENSNYCKTWCITFLSAILVMVVDKGKPEYMYLAILPILAFAYLDAYYLAQATSFRMAYDQFITKLHTNELDVTDLYTATSSKNHKKVLIQCLMSASIYLFYIALCMLVIVVKWIIF